MGADYLTASVVIEDELDLALQRIRSLNDQQLLDGSDGRLEFLADEDQTAQETAEEMCRLVYGFLEKPWRDMWVREVRPGVHEVETGGMSWGDSPTESFEPISFMQALGVASFSEWSTTLGYLGIESDPVSGLPTGTVRLEVHPETVHAWAAHFAAECGVGVGDLDDFGSDCSAARELADWWVLLRGFAEQGELPLFSVTNVTAPAGESVSLWPLDADDSLVLMTVETAAGRQCSAPLSTDDLGETTIERLCSLGGAIGEVLAGAG